MAPSGSAHVRMLMRPAGLAAMGVTFRADLHGNCHQTAVLYAALGNHLLGKFDHLANRSFEDRNLHAAFVVQVHVQG